jgi:hypothetical protein
MLLVSFLAFLPADLYRLKIAGAFFEFRGTGFFYIHLELLGGAYIK